MQDYLSDLYRKISGKMKLGLERAELLMQGLGNPEKAFDSIHVAGSNGKGSVVAVTAALLQATGLKVGRFTSPHLVHFHERIRINGKCIGDDAVKAFLLRHKDLLESSRASFFEVTTALAFDYFRQEKVDVAVVETGLGGRLDATSVLRPAVSVISVISYDHMDILGDTLEKIAEEKAGIIKKGVPLVTCPQEDAVIDVFRKHSSDLRIVKDSDICSKPLLSPEGMRFQIRDHTKEYFIPMVGRFQMNNIAMAVAAVETYLDRPLYPGEFEKGFGKLTWKGRFERLRIRPDIIYDVAHNPDGVSAFMKTLAEIYPRQQRYAVLAILKDKQPDKVLAIIRPYVQHLWLCPLASHRSMKQAELEELAKGVTGVSVAENLRDACDSAMKVSGPDDILAVLGSHYIAGELYEWNHEHQQNSGPKGR
jgi:dihydrofolate synthase / folylpolyglutamate synthase